MRRLLTPRWLGCHLLALVAAAGCLVLGWWQFRRASDGNQLSWGYTLEWPVFAGFVGLVWIRAVRDALRGHSRERPPPLARPGERVTPDQATGPVASDQDEPELTAYNRYLAWLTANPDRRSSEYPG